MANYHDYRASAAYRRTVRPRADGSGPVWPLRREDLPSSYQAKDRAA